MAASWKTVRVFISSTFSDMQAERDWLVKRVFPALRQKLEPLRLHLVDIDLRWGITREQAENDLVLGLCLQQIDECRPFFLGLLGGRYGWVPSKFPVEVGNRYGWTQHKTGKSVTELEILHGVLNNAEMHDRALFCFRSERFLDEIKDEQQRRVYMEGATGKEMRELESEEAELKNQIRALSPPMALFDDYPCTWDATAVDLHTKQPGRIGNLTEFGNWVIEKLERAILDTKELQEHLSAVRSAVRDDLAEERDFHERYIESRTRIYIGRKALQEELKAFVAGAETKPCLVTGPSGSGKSAALAEFVSVWRDQHSQDIVITHFAGASPRSTGLRETLRHLCAEVKDALKLEDEIKQDIRELPNQFREFLAKAPADRRILIVLDALNQLDETDNAHSLFWLPWQLPPQVRLIVSCIDDPNRVDQPALAAMRNRQPHEIKVGPLSDEERVGIVREIPSAAAKTLDEEQVKLLLQNEATRNPLFLLVALEELRGFGSFEKLNQKIAGLPQTGDTLTAIFQQVIRRLAEDFNADTVKDVLTLLACARRGLSERELLDLIEGENVAIEVSAGDLFPILRQLRPYLQSRGALLDFFHRHLAKATLEEFFRTDDSAWLVSHERLGDYFLACAKGDDHTSEWETDNVRGFAECVFHLVQAGQIWQAAEVLCDLRFVEARCRLKQVFDLIQDYPLPQEYMPDYQATKQQKTLVQHWSNCLVAYARAWSARRDREGQGERVADPEPLLPEIVPTCKVIMRTDEEIESTAQRIAEQPTLLDGLNAFAEFVGVECYPLMQFGDRAGFVVQHAFNHAPAGPVHNAADWLIPNCKAPLLLSRWPPDAPYNPNPALLRKLKGHSGQVTSVSMTPDGHRAISGSDDRTLRVWDLESGICLNTLEGHSGTVTSVSLTPDGRRAISGSDDHTLRVWNLESGCCVRTLEGHIRGVTSVSVVPDGRRAVSGSDDHTLRVWDLESGTCLRTIEGHRGSVSSMSITPDCRLAISAHMDSRLRVWDLESGIGLRTPLEGEGLDHTTIDALSMTPDGRRAVSGSGAVLNVWNVENGICVSRIEDLPSWITSVDLFNSLIFFGIGLSAVSVTYFGQMRIWDLMTGANILEHKLHCNGIWSSQVIPCRSADSGRLITACGDMTLRIWDLISGLCMHSLLGHTGGIRSVSITHDGRMAVSGSDDHTLRVWDLETGGCLQILTGHSSSVSCVVFTPDDRFAVSGSWDKNLRIWDLARGTGVRILTGHTGSIENVKVTPDGRRAISGSGDHTLRVWDLESGACLLRLEGHTDSVEGVNVTLDGRRAVSWSYDLTIRVWDLETGVCLHSLEGHNGLVTSVSLTPDGRHAFSGSNDKTMRVWDLESGSLTAVLHADASISALALGILRKAVFGTSTGQVIIVDLRNFPSEPALTRDSSAAEYESWLRRGLDICLRKKGDEHPETMAHLTALAAHLENEGKVDEARPFAEQRDRLITLRKAEKEPQSLRTEALAHYEAGDYSRAEVLLHGLLQVGFEPPGTHLHLARLCLLTDHITEARDHVAQSWEKHKETAAYVVPRMLWFMIVFNLLDGTSPRPVLGQIKTALQNNDAYLEWNMRPVLDHLRPKLGESNYALLKALVAAMSDLDEIAVLDTFPAWCEAVPAALE